MYTLPLLGPCNSFYCLGHFKNVYDDDDDDDCTLLVHYCYIRSNIWVDYCHLSQTRTCSMHSTFTWSWIADIFIRVKYTALVQYRVTCGLRTSHKHQLTPPAVAINATEATFTSQSNDTQLQDAGFLTSWHGTDRQTDRSTDSSFT